MPGKICFVGLDNYPVLNPDKGGEYFGGESVQQTLLAKAFRDIDYEVSMISLDYGQPQGEVVDGIRVWKTYRSEDGIPILRFIHPRITSLLSAMKQADADIYYQSCAGMLTGLVAWYCKRHKKKFVYRLAHDSDCIPGEQIIPTWRDRKIYEYGLKKTDLIAAQGKKQVALMQKHYALHSVPVNMVVQLPSDIGAVEKNIDILWVNNLREFKRPERVLELASMLPEYRITMIGGAVPGNESLFGEIKSGAEALSNLEFLGAVSYHEVNSYFSRARVFVNTSDWEGFPNSFLQAWVRGVPVLSFFDPDDLIVARSLGASPAKLEEMAEEVRSLLGNESTRKGVAERAHAFVMENYSPVSVARKYEALLDNNR
jgi:glycosyltransferase involved in cell wall biosynthesis